LFRNLESLTNGTIVIVNAKPDFFYGARLEKLDPRIREKLSFYPIGGREVHEFLGTGVLVVVPPKLTTMELALIYNYNPDSGQTSKLSFKIFSV
jgi:hypothetical protein